MRIGIFGGTFDPVHDGHLLLAECCREQARLDQVWFLPSAVPPHKLKAEITAAPHRVEMLLLAIAGNEAFRVCMHEIERGGVNYTADTLAALHEANPGHELFFLMGGDSLADLPTWKEPARICERATLVVVQRPGMAALDLAPLKDVLPEQAIAAIERHVVAMPRIDLSAREIRTRVAAHQSIRYRTPRAVEKYIETHALYR
jgi:nicotinate-nucleotide adenylyltransferase